MKLTRHVFVLSLLLCSFTGIYAQSDSTMTFSLSEAQQFALDNFYMSKNAELDIEAARWRVWESTAMGLPQVTTSANYQHIPGEIPTFNLDFGAALGEDFNVIYGSLLDNGLITEDDIPVHEPSEPAAIAVKNSVTYGFTVSQLIFSGEYIVGLRAAQVYKSLSENANVKTDMELKQQVADAYFGLLILEKNRTTAQKTVDNLRMNLEQIRKTYEAGMVEDTEVDQLDLVVKRTENQLSSLDRQIKMMRKMFKYIIGLDPKDEFTLTDSIDELIAENRVDAETYQFELEENIDYKLLETNEQLLKLNMNRMRSAYLPTVSAFYQYQDKTEKADFDFTINHIIGVSAQFPITSSGAKMAKVSQARVEYEKAVNKKEQEANKLVMDAQQTIYDYHNALDKYNNEKLNFELSEKVYEKTTAKYKEGMVSSLDLTLINNQYLQAQLSYSMAVQELLSAKVKMDKAFNKL